MAKEMTAIEKIKTKLVKYPELEYQAEGDRICIFPPTETGFTVWLTVNKAGYTVGFDGWHEEFDEEAEALNAFAFGLSDQCRLKVIKRGDADCAWVLEARDGGGWREDSTTGLLFTAFWKKKSVEYRRNAVISGQSNAGDSLKITPDS